MSKHFEVIGMCHLMSVPGDPNYNNNIDKTIERAKNDIEILQKNGFSKILFSNEFSYPYTNKISKLSATAISYIIGVLKSNLSIPFGVDCMYDPYTTIDVATAISADFYRISISDIDVDKLLLGEESISKIVRYANDMKKYTNSNLYLNIDTPLKYISEPPDICKLIDNIVTQINPYAICVSSKNAYSLIYNNYRNQQMIICDGGCNLKNIEYIKENSSGIIIGKSLKRDDLLENPIDDEKARLIISAVKKQH